MPLNLEFATPDEARIMNAAYADAKYGNPVTVNGTDVDTADALARSGFLVCVGRSAHGARAQYELTEASV